jgi:TnpA family transposase
MGVARPGQGVAVDIDLCRPDRKARYEHIDSLFGETINWTLIETHFPDMLRVVLSIKAGRISSSTILRRLGTYSRRKPSLPGIL